MFKVFINDNDSKMECKFSSIILKKTDCERNYELFLYLANRQIIFAFQTDT